MNDASRLSVLAAGARDSGGGAYEDLVKALWPNAYRIAWSILGDRGAAEDAAQTACATICQKLVTVEDMRTFAAWAYRIIVSHARDSARARRRMQSRESLGYDEAIAMSTRDEIGRYLDLESAIGRLPEHLRLAVELHYFVGLSSRESAHALGVPAATVRFRLMMARRRLRPLLCDDIALPATPEIIL